MDNLTFDYCMRQADVWAVAEYSVADHNEKAKCNRWRWHWMDKALLALAANHG